ncbi:hypothetical protein MtrunA17_Chr1g0160401 [Medicago truncatula]|uniref:Transmembrane protein n=1 Tax=Medicago truncatula TaxID=3880 RepID=A0A396JL95_MEDTR|nr:hypothetical protein MtrunA17_Chr1g0160401 [Medicago truncatula]
MARNNEIVDLDKNTSQPFRLMVPRKKKNKKKHSETRKDLRWCFQPFASLVCFFFFLLFVLIFSCSYGGFWFCPPSSLHFSLSFNI